MILADAPLCPDCGSIMVPIAPADPPERRVYLCLCCGKVALLRRVGLGVFEEVKS